MFIISALFASSLSTNTVPLGYMIITNDPITYRCIGNCNPYSKRPSNYLPDYTKTLDFAQSFVDNKCATWNNKVLKNSHYNTDSFTQIEQIEQTKIGINLMGSRYCINYPEDNGFDHFSTQGIGPKRYYCQDYSIGPIIIYSKNDYVLKVLDLDCIFSTIKEYHKKNKNSTEINDPHYIEVFITLILFFFVVWFLKMKR